MNISLSKLDRECRARGDVPGNLGHLKSMMIKFNHIADAESRPGRPENEKDVVASLRVAVVKGRVECSNCGTHAINGPDQRPRATGGQNDPKPQSPGSLRRDT